MRLVYLYLGLMSLLLWNGCFDKSTDPDNGPYDLTVRVTGMEENVGDRLVVRVIDRENDSVVFEEVVDSIPDDEFTVEILDALEEGKEYRVDFYADANGNGKYDAPPTDHAWRLEIKEVGKAVTLEFARSDDYVDVAFGSQDTAGTDTTGADTTGTDTTSTDTTGTDTTGTDTSSVAKLGLTVNFTGMDPHLGQLFELQIIDPATGLVVADTAIDSLGEAAFSLDFPQILMDSMRYHVDFYADHNGNGQYDDPPADHTWREVVQTADSSVTVDFQHNTQFTFISFKSIKRYALTLNFLGMDPHLGQLFRLKVVDRESGEIASSIEIDSIDKTGFTLEFGKVLLGDHSYNIDFFADMNENGKYDDPPTDHSWREQVGNVSGPVTIDFQHNTAFTFLDFEDPEDTTGTDTTGTDTTGTDTTGTDDPPPAKLGLTLDLDEMNQHVLQWMAAQVIDSAKGTVVAETSLIIPSGSFEVEFGKVLDKHTPYSVQFFADYNRNFRYDAPNFDHAWRLSLHTDSSDTTLAFTHGHGNMVDIGLDGLLYDTSFALTMEMESFKNSHHDETMYLFIKDTSGNVLADTSRIIPGGFGPFEVEMANVLNNGDSFEIDIFVDRNGNGKYDGLETDESWRGTLESVSGDVDASLTHRHQTWVELDP